MDIDVLGARVYGGGGSGGACVFAVFIVMGLLCLFAPMVGARLHFNRRPRLSAEEFAEKWREDPGWARGQRRWSRIAGGIYLALGVVPLLILAIVTMGPDEPEAAPTPGLYGVWHVPVGTDTIITERREPGALAMTSALEGSYLLPGDPHLAEVALPPGTDLVVASRVRLTGYYTVTVTGTEVRVTAWRDCLSDTFVSRPHPLPSGEMTEKLCFGSDQIAPDAEATLIAVDLPEGLSGRTVIDGSTGAELPPATGPVPTGTASS